MRSEPQATRCFPWTRPQQPASQAVRSPARSTPRGPAEALPPLVPCSSEDRLRASSTAITGELVQALRPHPRVALPSSSQVLALSTFSWLACPPIIFPRGGSLPGHLFGRSGVCTWQPNHRGYPAAHWAAGIQEGNI